MPRATSRGGGESPARLEVRLLGGVDVVLDGRRLQAFDSLRLQRFLALIALRREVQHRSRLAFVLWPDSGEGQARTNLRKLLHDFRHSLPDVGEFVQIDNEVVRWIPTGRSEVDVLSFRDAIAVGDLELAARLYSGDLLPACYDDWVLDERTKLRTEAYGVLVRLTEQAVRRHDHAATIRHTRGIIDLEPTDEAAVRIQMETHLARGDRNAALRSYHRYAEALGRDGAVEPSDAIRAVYRQLRPTTPHRTERQGAQTAPVAEVPFVGRVLELDRLDRAWRAAREGRAHLVLLAGEPGIGKSRLAREFGRRVRAEGHAVASARAYEAAGRLPWGPVVDLLRSDALRGHIDTLGAIWRAELARLLPELHEASQSPASVRSGDLPQRHRLFDAVGRAIVGERPRLLIVDDLQWCDAETIELIGYVVRSGPTAPILIVGTVRWEEVPEHHPLVGLVHALGHDRAVTTVPLDRLDRATTAALAAAVRDADVIAPELAARLWAETEGNPLFVIEVLRVGVSAEDRRAALTPTMRAVLGARLDQLPDSTRRLAEVAAVIGRSFSVGLLASATGSGEPALVDDLDELWRRRIIRDQGLTYDFSHDKLRAVALETISPARRRHVHRAVAEAIAVEFRHDLAAASPQLAAHYDEAGMVEPAIDAFRMAGARAVSVSALDEAVRMFRRALALLAELPPSPSRDALELDIRIALGSPLVALEGYGSPGAHQLYARALSLCRMLHRAVDPPILRGLGLARLQGCRFDESSRLGQALVDHESHDPIARTEGRYLLGVSAFWRGDLARARHFLEGAVEGYDVSHRNEHLALYAQDPKAVCLVRLAWVDLWTGDAARADERARAALQLAVDLDHFMTRWYVLTYAAIIAAESEDLVRLAELLRDAELLGKRLPMPYLMIVGDALRGWLDVCEGSSGGIERIVRSVARSRTEGESLHLTYTLLLLARARGMTGELHEGRAATREALSWTHRRSQHYLEAELWRVDGELAYRSGAPGAAAALRRAVEVAAGQGASWLQLRALDSLASRYPGRALREQLRSLVETIPSGRDLPAFRTATGLLSDSR
ncbi:AAA family ATPase [Geodermatophilus sp. YIM 151500]|uniref:ATP-binding protein n=1 Tax=Geodermatophilus sp. YIM 151500 TaxID=2984531 RepID=UPI0021E3E4C4|nr:AAA family ATPase [Geodermatophilus sp. YIM 151500]MCV2490974.1 AAA family ATPase [Geodermatophilus sp. YIM 151500]